MLNLLRFFFGSSQKEILKEYYNTVIKINNLEPIIQELTDEQLKNKTSEFKTKLKSGETPEQILPEVFAVVREVALRTLSMRHFDVQLVGGIVLYEGKIAEMKTGEGKTLVATLPVYLNALQGKAVHVVTVNDYLAKRDSEWMGAIYKFLGLTVGLIQNGMEIKDRQDAYKCNIVFGTNNEFGFDYLRDNMANSLEECVQGNLDYAIVDEVDSILIDEARTPLIISGMVEENTEKFRRLGGLAKKLVADTHFILEEKNKNIHLTEEGIEFAEKELKIDSLYNIEHMEEAHMLVQSLKALYLFKRDIDYIVKDNQILIVDEFTGRLMVGRRFSDGLHQAIEAIEGLKIQQESQTLASITFQNYFRLYEKVGGMTGTAMTEAGEFEKIYGLHCVEIPTNKPLIRKDAADAIYKSRPGKYNAVAAEIKELHKKKIPALVGTISIEASELLSKSLKKFRIPHKVLNAKYHEQEAEIISQAGQPGAVTIATNMAGRGTDIVLGEGVRESGGLHVIGTERHESRRIDNQLRGRCGRQGDPGYSKFYVSLEDDLMRLFGSDRIAKIMESIGFDDSTPIEHGLISNSIERAQKKVELYHFNIRKQLLEYDNVMNKQREIIYKQRRRVLEEYKLQEKYEEIITSKIKTIVNLHIPEGIKLKDVNMQELKDDVVFLIPISITKDTFQSKKDIEKYLLDKCLRYYRNFIHKFDVIGVLTIFRILYLNSLDAKWIEHLRNMDLLRDGIGLRAYAQKDPLLEYKMEAYDMFQEMMNAVEHEIIENLFKIQIVDEREVSEFDLEHHDRFKDISLTHGEKRNNNIGTAVNNQKKIGRNNPCPCGSGKKYKHCCSK